MSWFYAENLRGDQTRIELSPGEHRHLLTVLRAGPGTPLTLTNGQGLVAEGTVEHVGRRETVCAISEVRRMPPSRNHNLTVALSTIRPARMDWAIEKLTELGIGYIQPLICEHSSIRNFKRDHLAKIAISAIKQSQQAWLPTFGEPIPFAEWLSAANPQAVFIAEKQENPLPFPSLNPENPVAVAIGPEGGFSPGELALARDLGIGVITLNDTILRTETAAVAAATVLATLRGA